MSLSLFFHLESLFVPSFPPPCPGKFLDELKIGAVSLMFACLLTGDTLFDLAGLLYDSYTAISRAAEVMQRGESRRKGA